MVAQSMLQNMLTYWQRQVTTEAVTLSADRLALLNVLNWGLRTPPCWSPTYQLIEQVSPLFEQSGLWEDWQAILQQTQQVAQITADEDKAVNVTIMLARLAHRQGNLPQAVRYYKQVIRWARHDEIAKARACSNLAYIYAEQGRFWRAEILGCYALQFFEREQLLDKLAHTHNHLGVLYLHQDKFRMAETHLRHAEELWQRQNDMINLVYSYLNLSDLYIGMVDYIKAIDILQKALKLSKIRNEPLQTATIHLNLSYIWAQQQDFESAVSALQQAETIYQSHGYQLGLAKVWHNLGLVYLAQNQLHKVKSYLQSSLKLYDELDYQRGKIEVLEILVKIDPKGH